MKWNRKPEVARNGIEPSSGGLHAMLDRGEQQVSNGSRYVD